jgi:hypothetical protein
MKKYFFSASMLLFSVYSINTIANTVKPIIPESKPYSVKNNAVITNQKEVTSLGWVENVCMGDLGLKLKSKIDTGASTSSVNSDIIKIVSKGKKKYVYYRIIDDEFKSDVIQAELTRYTLIKPKMEDLSVLDKDDKIRRPVVMTEFKIGNKIVREEVNLADREHFSYPLLIGRNVLKNNFTVDASKTFLTKTRCPHKKVDD